MSSDQEQQACRPGYREKVGTILHWLQEKKAEDIVALDVQSLNNLTEAVILASASTMRHAQALADGLMEFFGQQGYELLGMEGYQVGTWILIDGNDVILHIFQSEARSFYHLESLWTGAPRLDT